MHDEPQGLKRPPPGTPPAPLLEAAGQSRSVTWLLGLLSSLCRRWLVATSLSLRRSRDLRSPVGTEGASTGFAARHPREAWAAEE